MELCCCRRDDSPGLTGRKFFPGSMAMLSMVMLLLVLLCPPGLGQTAVEPQLPSKTVAGHLDEESADELAQFVHDKLQSIPDPRSLKRDDLPRIFLILDEGIAAGRRYVSDHPDGAAFPAVCCDLGRMLVLNVDRHVGELNEEAKIFGAPLTSEQRLSEQFTYLVEVEKLARQALKAEMKPSLRCRLEVLLGDCLLKMRNPSGSADAFMRALRLDTSLEDVDEMRIKLIESLEIAERYSDMLKAGNEALEKHPRSPFLPHLVYFTHKAHRHLGLLRKGRDLWRLWGPVLRAGASGGAISIPGIEAKWRVPTGKENDFLLIADRAGFYEGFYQLALGERQAALSAFLAFNDALNTRINGGEVISMATKTYLDFQSIPMAQRVDVLHGKKAPSLDGLHWVQPPPEKDPDKTIELRLLCDSSRAGGRQARFITLLKKLELEYSSRGLRVVWISSVLRKERTDKEAASMAAIANAKLLGWSYGVQPGQEAGVIERHLGSHGGTLLLAIDADGLIQWEVIDPMFWDEGLYRTIINRLLHEE